MNCGSMGAQCQEKTTATIAEMAFQIAALRRMPCQGQRDWLRVIPEKWLTTVEKERGTHAALW